MLTKNNSICFFKTFPFCYYIVIYTIVFTLCFVLSGCSGNSALNKNEEGNDTDQTQDESGSSDNSGEDNIDSDDNSEYDDTDSDSGEGTKEDNSDSDEDPENNNSDSTVENPNKGPGNNSGNGNNNGNNNSGNDNNTNKPNNTIIDNIEALDSTRRGWGPGPDVNDKNQPYSALSYQKKYEKYNAHFIVPDSDKIYLVINEGYENGYTPSVLDTLKEKNVKAVFLMTSGFARREPDLVWRMINEGHIVGNHSYSHPSNGFPSISIAEQQEQIMKMHDYIKETFNYEMHIFGFPSGTFSEQGMAIANNCNYKTVFWSFAYRDWDVNNPPDPTESLNRMINKLHPGAIYMLHVTTPTNPAILGDFIDQTRAAGYEFGLFQ